MLTVNRYAPFFIDPPLPVKVYAHSDINRPIATLRAFDGDTSACLSSSDDCACAKVMYRIVSGNRNDLFRIDSETGQLFAKTTYPLEATDE